MHDEHLEWQGWHLLFSMYELELQVHQLFMQEAHDESHDEQIEPCRV